jgi:pyruvate dehydrogenase E2 component (dihydrolipoamide acetyltransferase)
VKYKIVMPALGETMDEGTIIAWRKAPGDWVDKSEVLMEVMTDKATFEVEAGRSGYLRATVVGLEDSIRVGETVAWVSDSPDEPLELDSHPVQAVEIETVPVTNGSESAGRVPDSMNRTGALRVSPRARRLLDQYGVSAEEVARFVANQTIEASDVEDYVRSRTASGGALATTSQMVKVTGMRKIIADRMTRAATVPQVTLHSHSVVDTLLSRHRNLKQYAAYRAVTLTDWIIKAAATILVDRPDINARYNEDSIESLSVVNIGLAMDAPYGLTVPVLHRVETLDLVEIASERRRLTDMVQERHLGVEDLHSGSFTISNLGTYGIDQFGPLLNLPEVAILGVGRLQPLVIEVEGRIVGQSRLPLSLTFDHRAVDGGPAATFLNDICQLLADPPQSWTLDTEGGERP